MLRSAILLLAMLPAFCNAQNDPVFVEDFAFGFEGNNGFGSWTVVDSGNDSIWMVADELSPVSDFPAPEVALNSASADNGWVIFDTDRYNLDNDPPVSTWGYLVSPYIDMTGMESVIVEWDQYYRYCCGWKSPITLEASADGGNSWESYPAHGQYIESADWTSPNAQCGRLDITCVAANKDSVLIRFGFNAAQDPNYGLGFWGIDDVVVMENPLGLELEIEKLAVKPKGSQFEYDCIAPNHLESDSICASVYIRKHGLVDPTSLEVEFFHFITEDIESYTSITLEDENGIWGCSPNQVIEVQSCVQNWNADNGPHVFRVDLPTDDMTSNNVAFDSISFSNDFLGPLEFNSWHDTIYTPYPSHIPGLYDPAGIGFVNEGIRENFLDVCKFIIGFGEPVDGLEFEIRFYLQELGVDSWMFYEAGFYLGDSGWSNSVVSLPLDSYVEINEDEWYLSSIITEFESEFPLTIRARAGADYFHVSRVYEWDRMNQDWRWTPTHFLPLIWTDFDWCGSVVSTTDNSKFNVFPNPSSGSVSIESSSLLPNQIFTVTVIDMQGNGVFSSQTSGDEQLNLSCLPIGQYILQLTTEKGPFFEKLMIVH